MQRRHAIERTDCRSGCVARTVEKSPRSRNATAVYYAPRLSIKRGPPQGRNCMTTTTLERPRNETSVGIRQDRVPQASPAAPTYRKTATTVGVIYIMGMDVGIGGNILIQSLVGGPDY